MKDYVTFHRVTGFMKRLFDLIYHDESKNTNLSFQDENNRTTFNRPYFYCMYLARSVPWVNPQQ